LQKRKIKAFWLKTWHGVVAKSQHLTKIMVSMIFYCLCWGTNENFSDTRSLRTKAASTFSAS